MAKKPTLERLFRWLARRRVAALAGLVVSLVPAVLGMARIRSDFTIEHYFPRSHPERSAYERLKASFPLGETRALVMVEAPDVFAPEILSRIEAVARDLAALPEVRAVIDPLSVLDAVRTGPDEVTLVPLIGSTRLGPPSTERLAAAREAVRREPLFRNRIANPELTAAAIDVRLRRDVAGTAEGREAFLRGAERALAPHRAYLDLTLTGTPTIRAQFVRGIARDMGLLLPIAAAIAALFLLWSFRSFFDAAAALTGSAVGIAWTFGLLGAAGIPLTFLTQTVPVVVLTVGLSDAIHVITEMRIRRATGEASDDAVAGALATLAGPCLLTVITVVCGLLALLAMDVRLVDDFAITGSVGMLLTWLATMVTLPVIYGFRAPRPLEREEGGRAAIRLLDRALVALATLPMRRPRATALGLGACFLALAALGGRVGRECYLLDDLPASSPIMQARRRVEDRLGGTFSLVVHLSGAKGAILEPAAVDTLAACEVLLAREPEVERTASILDYLRKTHSVLAPELARAHPLPRTRGLIAQELEFSIDPRQTPDYLDHQRAHAAVYARVRDLGSTRMRALLGRLGRSLDRVRALAPPGLTIELTGIPVVMQGVFDEVIPDLWASFGLSILLGLCVFTLLFRSLRFGIIAIVPNALPSLATLACMAVWGIDLKPSTVMVFSVAFAIATDDTIHYLARVRRYLARGEPRLGLAPDDLEGATLHGLRESGLAIVLTSAALALGFSVLGISQFLPVVYVGVLTALTLTAAALTEVFMTPLLLLRFALPRRRRPATPVGVD